MHIKREGRLNYSIKGVLEGSYWCPAFVGRLICSPFFAIKNRWTCGMTWNGEYVFNVVRGGFWRQAYVSLDFKPAR